MKRRATILLRAVLGAFLCLALFSAPLEAQVGSPSVGTSAFDPEEILANAVQEEADSSILAEVMDGPFGAKKSIGSLPERLSTPLEIALLLTVLSLLPAALICVTSFTRIVIVLSFVRRSLSVNELPPNPIIIGLALFLTMFVMAPVGKRMYEAAYVPYAAGELGPEGATEAAWGELRGFLVDNTRPGEMEFFQGLAGEEHTTSTFDQLPFQVVVPAFVLSELKTAFQMGFLLFLPFLVIDLVVSSVLLSMGMFMLPPVMISTPFKILLFVLVDGWTLVCRSLVTSFTLA